MFRFIGSSILALGLLLGASQAAEAHGAPKHRYDPSGYHYGTFHRNRHMPRWLWHKRGFRHWYFRTPLRFNRHMAWWQLHDAYRWERRRNFRRQFGPYYSGRQRDFDRNGRYWQEFEHRPPRPRERRRNRDH